MNNFIDELGFAKNLEAHEIIGNGTFGIVYKCFDKRLNRDVALKKIFWNSSPLYIFKEMESLMTMTKSHCRNIVRLINLFRFKDMVFIETEYYPHQSIKSCLNQITNDYIFCYMRELLIALSDIHDLGYIHCDIKPSNFLFDGQKGHLCDFGLCEKQNTNVNMSNTKENLFKIDFESFQKDIKTKPYIPNTKKDDIIDNSKIESSPNSPLSDSYSTEDFRESMWVRRGGTRGYRAPEVLWRMENQTTAIDIWSAGIIFISLLSKRIPFLSGKDDLTDLYEISCIVGKIKLQLAALMCGRFLAIPDNGQEDLPLVEIVKKLNPSIMEMNVPDSAFDLLEKMLDPSPKKRISARKCLEHPYFTYH